MDKRKPLKYVGRDNSQSPKYLRHQQQFKTNPKRLRRTSLSEFESVDIPTHDSSLDGTTFVEQTITYYKKYDLLNVTILIALIIIFMSFITIIITFIFPNWLVVNISTSRRQNYDTILSYAIYSDQLPVNSTSTQIDIGLWEFKFNQSIQIYTILNETLIFNSTLLIDQLNYNINSNLTKYSVLWISSYNNYLLELTDLIDYNLSTVFIVEVLEILHIIFTFLTICMLFIILCLCHKKYFGRGVRLWHFVSFLLLLISFFMGLGTIIQMSIWAGNNQMNTKSVSYNWCFWCLVGDTSAQFIALLLLLINLIFACISCYKKANKEEKQEDSKIISVAEDKGDNSRSSLALLKSSKTTPNVSTIELNHQAVASSTPPDDHLIKPSSLFNKRSTQQDYKQMQQHKEPEYINERTLSIPRPNLTSSNINMRSPSATSNNYNNNNSKFDNYIYYNGGINRNYY